MNEMRRGQSSRSPAQASVELALLVPIALVLIFATLGIARVTAAAISLSAVVRESARAGAEGDDAANAFERAYTRGELVAAQTGLRSRNLDLAVDISSFGPAGQVRASGSYTVSLVDMPFLRLGLVRLSRWHAEAVGTYRGVGP